MDKKLASLVKKETERQNKTIDLIASENIASPDVREMLRTSLTNKYSEGYPGRRYYPGNEFCDEIENLARSYALKAFGLSSDKWAANVQAYSGSPANLAIYLGLVKPGETIMGMKLAYGGHLTHGHLVSVTGKIFKSVQYETDPETGLINYDAVRALALEHKPRVIISGATAYPRKIDFKKFGEIADEIGAYHVVDISHIAGLVAGGEHPAPFQYADAVMTTTHKSLRGPRGAVIFARKEPLKGGDGKTIIAEAIDKAVFPGLQGGPHNNQTAAIAQAFYEVLRPGFKKYARQIVRNAAVLAEELKKRGFNLVADGTDNHLILIDLKNIGQNGQEAESSLQKNGIIANRNSVPGDASPFKPTGIRLGVPCITTRGMKEREMKKIAEYFEAVLIKKRDIVKEVESLAKKFDVKKLLK